MPRRNSRRSKAESPGERRSIGISAANLSSFPRQVQTAYKAGVRDAEKYMPGRITSVKVAKRSIFNSIRRKASERSQMYLNEPNKFGQAYRAGIRDTVKAEMSGDEWPIEMRSDYVRRGGEWVRPNPRRRRRNESAETRRARRMLMASRYTRLEVIASKASARAIIRALSGISSPHNPSGYPLPSNRSW